MWPSRDPQKERLKDALQTHSTDVRSLPGIADPAALETFAMQLIASLRREDYYQIVQRKRISPRRADPNSPSFDAERAVAYHIQNGDIEEAAWLVFLMTYFGHPADTGWLRLKDFYGMLGQGRWSWDVVKNDPHALIAWLADHWSDIRGKFGNHRRYESLRPDSDAGFHVALQSYLGWIGSSHAAFFRNVVRRSGNNPHTIFDALYHDMEVERFGRLGKFDYLALIGRYRIAPISAGSAYLHGATGPLRGVRLLFLGNPQGAANVSLLQERLDELDASLQVGMQVMEDALCNWQKNPTEFVHFKG